MCLRVNPVEPGDLRKGGARWEEVPVNHPPAHEENYETQDKEHSFGEGRGTPHEVKG